MIKSIAKTIIPETMWRKIRRRKIISGQLSTAKLCDNYIDRYFKTNEILFRSEKKKDLDEKRIIWQYWAQGFDGELPEVVKICLDSVDRYKGDAEVIRLSDETIADYVDLPDFVWKKKGNGFSTTSFSNVLRLALLYLYGGVWIDATVLLTAPIPEKYFAYEFFMFQRDESEPNKEYWENSYAYYFGWGPDFRVRVLTSIAFAHPGSSFIKDYLNTLLYVWRDNDVYPFYFTFQVLFNQLIASGKTAPNCPIESDCTPHIMMQIINDESAPFSYGNDLYGKPFHKLSYKEINLKRFKSIINDSSC